MTNIITVVGALASTNGVTVFRENGTSEIFGNDKWETKKILEAVLVPLAQKGKVQIDLDKFTLAEQIKAALPDLVVKKDAAGTETLTVKEGDKNVVIPDAKKLKHQIQQAVFGNGAAGFRRFLSSFGAIEHKHSAEELLAFMERGDLPICNDGQLLVYKSLKQIAPGVYADTHTGMVRQKLGSRVSMPVGKVSDDRRTSCATGLHVCSKHYGTYGGITFLAKVPAADVIAVPKNENGKVRCASYHLVYLLPSHLAALLANRQSILEHEDGRELVTRIINGDHVGVLEEVVVGGSTVVDTKTPITVTRAEKPSAPVISKDKVMLVDTERMGAVDITKARHQIEAAQSGNMSAAINAAVQDSVKPPKIAQKPKKAAASKAPASIFITEQEPVAAKKPDKKVAPKTTTMKKPSPPPAMTDKREIEYQVKLAKAKALIANGSSLRQVAKELGMCRESLSKRLKAE